MIVYPTRWFVRGESWFEPVSPPSGVDLVVCFQAPVPLPGAISRPFHTYLISLRESPDVILSGFNRSTRREIRGAHEEDHLRTRATRSPSAADLTVFARLWAEFSRDKGLPAGDMERLRSMARAGRLWLSFVETPDGEVLVAHACYVGRERLRGMFAPSSLHGTVTPERRRLLSRASRYLNWTDMLAAKEAGLVDLDMGGWYVGNDAARLRLNEYKTAFGGRVVTDYNSNYACSVKGRLALRPLAFTEAWRRATKEFPRGTFRGTAAVAATAFRETFLKPSGTPLSSGA